MEKKNNFTGSLYKDLDMEEAISHRVHSRLFEILGYLDLIDRSQILPEDHINLARVEELCKTLINEMHSIIDHYKGSEK